MTYKLRLLAGFAVILAIVVIFGISVFDDGDNGELGERLIGKALD